MKAKKAVKRLTKVGSLITNVIDNYASEEGGLRALLDSAKASVVKAHEMLSLQVSAAPPNKPPVKAQSTKRAGLSAEGRKRLSVAAKKRWAIAKRKGVSAVTGRPLAKTA